MEEVMQNTHIYYGICYTLFSISTVAMDVKAT